MLFPPPYLTPDDPNGKNLGFENDGHSDEDAPIGNGEPPKGNGDKLDEPEEDSSGFREELDDRSDFFSYTQSKNVQLNKTRPQTRHPLEHDRYCYH